MLARIRETYHQIPLLPQVVLVGANLLPLFGVIFLDWSIAMILAIYWAETGVIGFYTIFKIKNAEGKHDGGANIVDTDMSFWSRSAIIGFFIFHFGLFMTAHAGFLMGLFSSLDILGQFTISNLWLPVVVFALSHGVSYWRNYLRGGEYKRLSARGFMKQPYKRVFAMHLVIVFSVFVVDLIGTFAVTSVVFLVAIKTALDLTAHRREHTRIGN